MLHLGVSDYYPFQLLDKANEYFFHINPWIYFNRNTAYILSKSGAHVLQKYSRCVQTTADDLLYETFREDPLKFRVFVPAEPLFHEPPDTLSLIYTNSKRVVEDSVSEQWLFFSGVDSCGYDIHKEHDGNINRWFRIAEERHAVAFNSQGFFKLKVILPLERSLFLVQEMVFMSVRIYWLEEPWSLRIQIT